MRIKRLEVHDLRNLRGRRVLDFTDPTTGDARDLDYPESRFDAPGPAEQA